MIIKTHYSYIDTDKYKCFYIYIDDDDDISLRLVHPDSDNDNDDNEQNDEYCIFPDGFFIGYHELEYASEMKRDAVDSLTNIISDCLSNEKIFCDLYQTFISERDK